MAWMELIIAGILEVFWSTMMKWSDGFSKINYSFLHSDWNDCQFLLFIKGNQKFADESLLSYLDRDWRSWFGHNWCGLVS